MTLAQFTISYLWKGIIFFLLLGQLGCTKEPGLGGTASIKGNAHLYVYDADDGSLKKDYSYINEDIYIIYGNDSDKIYDDKTTTSYNGNYQFKYLYPGTYTIFGYSDCPYEDCESPRKQTIIQVEIIHRGQQAVIDTLRLTEIK